MKFYLENKSNLKEFDWVIEVYKGAKDLGKEGAKINENLY